MIKKTAKVMLTVFKTIVKHGKQISKQIYLHGPCLSFVIV